MNFTDNKLTHISNLIKISLLFLLILKSIQLNAQVVGVNDTIVMRAIVYNGDTLTLSNLELVTLFTRLTEAQKKQIAKYNRLRNAVYVTYPYAIRAGAIFNDVNAHLINVSDKKLRKAYIKTREKELKKEFTTPLTNLSVYQGKVLMKLINRETGSNCFEIIKELKSGFTASVYQTVAFFFDTNLKQSYEAESEDAVIEKIVKEVQRMYNIDTAPHSKTG